MSPRGRSTRWLWALPVFLAGLLLVPFWIILRATDAVAMVSSVASTVLRTVSRRVAAQMRTLKRLGNISTWASERRGLAGLSGITLVLVPTLFAVFPHWSEWRLLPKVVVLLVWLVCASIVVARTIRMERRIADLTNRQVAVEQRARTGTLNISVDAVLRAFASRFPQGYYLQVFIPDPDHKRLIPVRDPQGIGPGEGWRIDHQPPQAVTGLAWKTNEYVFAKGPAVSDATFALTSEQQRRYARLTGVSATPIRDPRGRPIGVLTLCTEEPDPAVSEREVVELQIALAAELAPALEDLGASVAPV